MKDFISEACPSCPARIRAPMTAAGKSVKCPKCGGIIRLPSQESKVAELDIEAIAANTFSDEEVPTKEPDWRSPSEQKAETQPLTVTSRDVSNMPEEAENLKVENADMRSGHIRFLIVCAVLVALIGIWLLFNPSNRSLTSATSENPSERKGYSQNALASEEQAMRQRVLQYFEGQKNGQADPYVSKNFNALRSYDVLSVNCDPQWSGYITLDDGGVNATGRGSAIVRVEYSDNRGNAKTSDVKLYLYRHLGSWGIYDMDRP